MKGRRPLVAGLAAGVGVLLAFTNLVGAVAQPPAVAVLAAPLVTAGPLTQAAGFGAIWVLSETEWIGNPADYTEITKIDRRTNRVVARVNVGYDAVGANSYPTGFLATGAGAVWVIDYNANQLIEISPSTDRVVARVSTGVSPTGVVVAAGSVWVSHQHTSAVWRFDPHSLAVTARIPAGATGHFDSTLGPLTVGRDAVWVSELFQGRVQRIDPSTDHVTTVEVGPSPSCGALVFVPGGFWLDDSLCGNVISRYDLAQHRISATITEPACLFPVTYGHDGLWITFSLGQDPNTGACRQTELGRFDPRTSALLAVRTSPGVGSVTDVDDGLWFGDIRPGPPASIPEYHAARF